MKVHGLITLWLAILYSIFFHPWKDGLLHNIVLLFGEMLQPFFIWLFKELKHMIKKCLLRKAGGDGHLWFCFGPKLDQEGERGNASLFAAF